MSFPLRVALPGILVGLSLLLPSTDARANGRQPGSNQLLLSQPDGEGYVVLRGSFGLAIRKTSGGPFHWVCEQALGYVGDVDPGVQLLGTNISVAGPTSLTQSADQGCGFTTILEGRFRDVSMDRDDPTSGVAISDDENCSESRLFTTSDGGQTWLPLGVPIAGLCSFTLDRVTENKNRIYVSGNKADGQGKLHGYIVVSEDAGATWAWNEMTDEPYPFIAGIDPADMDRLYVRTNAAAIQEGKGRLLVSKDAGKTFSRIAELSGLPLQHFGVTGFALSPDGAKVAFGSVYEGLFVMDRDGTPSPRAKFPVMCLTWTSSALFACGFTSSGALGPMERGAPFVIGKSLDEGQTFTPVLEKLTDLVAPEAECATDSQVNRTCAEYWPGTLARFGDAGANTTPGFGDAGSGIGTKPDEAPPKLGCACSNVAFGHVAYGGALAGLAAAGVGFLGVLRRRRPRR